MADNHHRLIMEPRRALIRKARRRARRLAMVETRTPSVRKEPAPPTEMTRGPFQNLRNEIDRVFDEFMSWSPLRGSPFNRLGSRMLEPAADVVEADGIYEIDVDVPGVAKEDIEIMLSHGRLTVRCNLAEQAEEEHKGYYFRERRHQSFSRSFHMPADADPEKIEAELANGGLRIRLPKMPEGPERPRKVAIKAH